MSAVICTGPIFDGRGQAAVSRFCADAPRTVAHASLVQVHTNLNESIRYPTPYYETQINMHPVAGGQQVDDRGVIYGHWLEGDGSRNRTTRFKGYWSFRRAHDYVQRHVVRLIEADVRAMIARLNG
jgi:hypothetical protein